MLVKDEKTIKEVQQEFNREFPFLRIEFYRPALSLDRAASPQTKWEPNTTIGAIRTVFNTKEFRIHKQLNTRTLENKFKQDYGLKIKIFYKSTNTWFPTSRIDESTLRDHNEIGEVARQAREKTLRIS